MAASLMRFGHRDPSRPGSPPKSCCQVARSEDLEDFRRCDCRWHQVALLGMGSTAMPLRQWLTNRREKSDYGEPIAAMLVNA